MESSRHILIVEDESSLARVLADELRDQGFTVSTAANGIEGLSTALAEHPDLIFVDVIMPGMDCLSLIKALRQDPWGKHVRIVILTNVSNAALIDRSFDSGVYEYIVKADWELGDIIRIAKEKLAVPTT
jgi:two-component system alkaline phosphatase synthesis response regulator PhoP